jgi:hypothetical protein
MTVLLSAVITQKNPPSLGGDGGLWMILCAPCSGHTPPSLAANQNDPGYQVDRGIPASIRLQVVVALLLGHLI